MKLFKQFFLIVITVHSFTASANILLQKPELLSIETIETQIKKKEICFTWSFKNKKSCTLTYENGKAGFAIKHRSIPYYFKNYRLIPTIRELKSYFTDEPYLLTTPLQDKGAHPTAISPQELYAFIKNKNCVFYTGAGISAANNVATMDTLMKSLHIAGKNDPSSFIKYARNNSQEIRNVFAEFCESMMNTAPTTAHYTLKNIALEKECAIITENVDLLQHRTEIEAIHSHHPTIAATTPEQWQQVDVIICIGLSRDDRGLLAWYKQHNPNGILIAVDLKTPKYLSDADFVCLGDIQEIFSDNSYQQYFQQKGESMQKTITQLPEIKLVGITTRTNNKQLFEADPATNKVAATVQKYFYQGFPERINHRKKPGTTYCVYTNYESDLNGDYTYFIGEEVTSFDDLDPEIETLTIPAQTYAKCTSEAGPMPTVCIDLWKDIWAMNDAQLGGKRTYIADFELYDERSADHTNVVLDIFIGIEK